MSLPREFAGRPASVGARVGAFSIDAVVTAGLAVATGLVTGSLAFAALVAVEVVLALWILQARTGASPGKALLRLRVSTAESPASPGAARAFVRGSIVGMGALAFAVGAWVVEASGVWDRSGRRRSWADRAAQTFVVALPPRGQAGTAYAAPAPGVVARPRGLGEATDSSRTDGAPRSLGSRSRQAPLPPAPAPSWNNLTAVPRPIDPAPTAGAPTFAPEETIVGGVAAAPASGELLISFDTGQRVRLALPVAVVLGRAPSPAVEGDAVIAVHDPDRSVSKDHVRIEYDPTGVWVTDLGSTNGSELLDDDGRGRVLAARTRTRADDDARVRIGDRTFTLSRLVSGDGAAR